MVEGVKHFHHYLYGTECVVRTDHNALKWLMNFKNPTGQTAQWLEVMGTYTFRIEFRPGLKHGNAYGLPRRPCEDCKQCDHIEKSDQQETEESTGTDTQQMLTQRVAAVVRTERDSEEVALDHVEENREGIRLEQHDDQNIGTIIRWKEGTRKPPWNEVAPESKEVKCLWMQWDQLQLRNGVLYRLWESDDGAKISWHLVVPKTRRDNILSQLHDVRTAGHLGVKKTESRVQERFYWPNYRADIYNIGAECVISVLVGKDRNIHPVHPCNFTTSEHPWKELLWTTK